MYQLGATPPSRLIIAHLGNGCSMTAVRGGRSIDTSMGLTPTGGVISSARTGDIDPGVLLYILRDLKPDEDGGTFSRDEAANKLETLVNRKSGMVGVSGMSDMRDLRGAIQAGNPLAAMAVAQFTYVIRKFIGAILPCFADWTCWYSLVALANMTQHTARDLRLPRGGRDRDGSGTKQVSEKGRQRSGDHQRRSFGGQGGGPAGLGGLDDCEPCVVVDAWVDWRLRCQTADLSAPGRDDNFLKAISACAVARRCSWRFRAIAFVWPATR